MKFRITSCLLLMLAASFALQARMYQWVNPNDKNVQLSGIPPAWYRSESGGPRVRVFELGNLIDDTSIVLPPSQSEELRGAAFKELQQRQQAEALRKLELLAHRKVLKEKEDNLRAERVASERAQQQAQHQQEQNQQAKSGDNQTVDASMIDKLKSLVGQFDRQGVKQNAAAKIP